EARIALVVADLLDGRRLPLTAIGTSVDGLENGPILIYLLALPFALARDPAIASGFVALMNLGALVLAARFAALVFGWPAGLLAATTYAVGSWAVLFSRKIWPNDAMPLFSALL